MRRKPVPGMPVGLPAGSWSSWTKTPKSWIRVPVPVTTSPGGRPSRKGGSAGLSHARTEAEQEGGARVVLARPDREQHLRRPRIDPDHLGLDPLPQRDDLGGVHVPAPGQFALDDPAHLGPRTRFPVEIQDDLAVLE